MTKITRSIITIDEELCDGCGLCIPGCPEGALQIIDGKARLVSDLFCDGLGACIGDCPKGAISVEVREAEPYNETIVMENIIARGPNTIKAHLKHLKDHGEEALYQEAIAVLKAKSLPIPDLAEEEGACGGGCPGMMSMLLGKKEKSQTDELQSSNSELSQWPIQLGLINPQAGYFAGADLLVSADCVAHAYGAFHQKFLKGKKLIVFCPKLDQQFEKYCEKLAELFKVNHISSVTIVKMEVPCCSSTTMIVEKAMEMAGKNIPTTVHTVNIDGSLSE